MKNRITILLAGLVCAMSVASFSTTSYADTLAGQADWSVDFTTDKKMVSNFSSQNFDDVLDNMQPGDDALFKVTVQNSYSGDTDWYMTNAVLQSLEDASKTATGGAYSYRLTYTDPNGTESVLYDSEEVGGETYRQDNQGLHEATEALEDYFYLDTIASGKTGYVSLHVLLDGETQGNDYQDTLAQLQMNFAVELPTEGHGTKKDESQIVEYRQRENTYTDDTVYVTRRARTVKTGDETNLSGLYAVAIILGILCVLTGVMGIRARRRGGAR